ncbi:MAG TPA: ABC transporter ATP-binding protein, partial [Planctomycetaceae bacterium]|nr:ABC transporter ATP-binding protein [Planctomycetaceae bacterium]
MWRVTLKLGIKNILLHKLRSALTVLGVVLGVGSVIAMLAIGEGSKREALEQIKRLGANNVIIRSVKPGQKGEQESDASSASQQQRTWVLEYGLKYKDLERLIATLPTIKRALPVALVRKHAQRGHRIIMNARILGTTPDYTLVKNVKVQRGRFISDADLARTANVAVLGAGAARRLFSYEDPIGEPILIGSDVYRVVGVLAEQGTAGVVPGAAEQTDFNNDIIIPLSAAQRRFGELQMIAAAGSRSFERVQLSEITLTVADISLVTQTAAMAR